MALRVEDFNPFLIGMKFAPGIPLDSIKREMKKILKEADDYIVPPEGMKDISITIGLPIENLGLKEDVEIRLNLQQESFNIIGDDPLKVHHIFEEIYNLLPKLPFERESLISFYEIMANVGIKTDDNSPKEVLNRSFNVDFSDIISEINPNTSLVGIHLSSIGTNLDTNDFLDLTIEPKKGSHSNRYYAQIRYQTKEKNNITQFDTKSIISQMIKRLEEE